MKTYPLVNINQIYNEKGTYKKQVLLNKTFISSYEKGFFVKKNEKKFSETFLQNGKKKNNGFFLEILFHGLNYSAKRLKLYRKSYLIDVHKSEIFINKEKPGAIAKSRIYKRRLLFFSYDVEYLRKVEKYIKKLKAPNSYTGKGIFSREDFYKIKKVQKRK